MRTYVRKEDNRKAILKCLGWLKTIKKHIYTKFFGENFSI